MLIIREESARACFGGGISPVTKPNTTIAKLIPVVQAKTFWNALLAGACRLELILPKIASSRISENDFVLAFDI